MDPLMVLPLVDMARWSTNVEVRVAPSACSHPPPKINIAPCSARSTRRHLLGNLEAPRLRIRGLHSSTSQFNLNTFHGIGDARTHCVARVKGLLGGVRGR